MRTALRILILIMIVCSSTASAVDSHSELVAQEKSSLIEKRKEALASLSRLEQELKTRGMFAPEIETARKTIGEMKASWEWRNLSSRSTRTQEQAKRVLLNYLRRAESQVSVPRQRLAQAKKVEYAAWARENPEQAQILELKKQFEEQRKAAAFNDMIRSIEIGNAEAAAHDAQRAAERATQRAAQAERRAEAAENDACLNEHLHGGGQNRIGF